MRPHLWPIFSVLRLATVPLRHASSNKPPPRTFRRALPCSCSAAPPPHAPAVPCSATSHPPPTYLLCVPRQLLHRRDLYQVPWCPRHQPLAPYCKMCKNWIYFSNIQMKYLQHMTEISETFVTYISNIRLKYLKALESIRLKHACIAIEKQMQHPYLILKYPNETYATYV